MNKILLASIFAICALGLGLSTNAMADDKSDKFFTHTIDSADRAVGNVVKGTGNIIHTTIGGKVRKNVNIIGEATTDADEAE